MMLFLRPLAHVSDLSSLRSLYCHPPGNSACGLAGSAVPDHSDCLTAGELETKKSSTEVRMRFRFLALLIGILMLAPLISGCGKEKKEGPPEMVKSPDKKKN